MKDIALSEMDAANTLNVILLCEPCKTGKMEIGTGVLED